MAEALIDVLTQRENGDAELAQDIFNEMVERVKEGEDPEQVLFEEGLEPDYVLDLLEFLI
jgi:hypothetical protein